MFILCLSILNVSIAETIDPQIDISGYFTCNDGGHYYIRQIGMEVYWFGESKNGAWANVFKGRISGNTINGYFYDVPKGRADGKGELRIRIEALGHTLSKISGRFGGSRWTKTTVPSNLPTSRSAGFNANGKLNDLDGVWKCSDGGTYYLRETEGKVAWFGEAAFGSGRPLFANVAVGIRQGNTVTLDWVDVAKCNMKGKGKLQLKVNNANEIVKISGGGFGGRKWTRPEGSSPKPPIKKGLTGWVDMHAHPMSHLAFGGKVLHGAPDVDILMPVVQGCRHYTRPKNIEEALGSCNHTHGGHGAFDNTCGDHIRKVLVREVEKNLHAGVNHHEEGARGYPAFKGWPAQDNLTHQQMYVDWIKRCHDNGLSVMVALAVNNRTYAAAFSGPGDKYEDDVSSADIQIQEMKRMVSRHNWMEVVKTPTDLRRIVGQGKLAIILGIEVDDIGNFLSDDSVSAENPSRTAQDKVRREIKRLYDNGIRYIFPLHVVDNKFGGTAIYEPAFNTSNYHQTGEFWNVGCAQPDDNIGFKYSPSFDIGIAAAKAKIGIDAFRNPPTPPSCQHGHINNIGLTNLGKFAVKEMMKLGMMIDVDHMSQRTINDIISIAQRFNYPLNSGHSSVRKRKGIERNMTVEQYNKIADLGGIAGLGVSNMTHLDFMGKYRVLKRAMKGQGVAIGTDANGFEKLPKGGKGIIKYDNFYDNHFHPCKTGNKTWDYTKDGVAHYGLMADFLRDIGRDKGLGKEAIKHLNKSAEYFAKMWEKSVQQSRGIR